MLIIDDYEKLNALLKLLWTIKFDIPSEHCVEFAASPFVAEIYQQTYQATVELLRKEQKDGVAFSLENELSGKHAFELEAIERHIEFLKTDWLKWEIEKKRNFVKLLLSPFTVPENKIEEIVKKYS
jgi:hypothetical protein